MPLVMGVASVAAGARVEIRDADDGHLVAVGTAAHPPPTATGLEPGEQAVEAWWDTLVDAIAAAGRVGEVAGLAVAAQRQALVLVDGAGSPLGPGSLRHDGRAGTVADELVARLGADRLVRATGQLPGADTPLARLVWLLAADPGLAARVDGVLGAADVLTARLTGRRATDRGGASGTGWWNPVTGRWRDDLLVRAARPAPPDGWAATLPDILGPSEVADRVSASIHDLAGLRGRPLVAAGTGDLMARALAAGVEPGAAAALLDDDDAVVVAGTATPTADLTGAVLGLADAAGAHLPTVALAPIGRALASVGRLLGGDATTLGERATLVAGTGPADAGRLLVVAGVPRPSGRRPPGRLGGVLGLDDATTPADLARAALLGAAAEVVAALGLLDGVGGGEPEDGAVLLAGAVARSPGLAGAVADLIGREVHVVRGGGAAAGACAQAAAAVGGVGPLEVARSWGLDAGETVEPSSDPDTEAVLALHQKACEGLRTVESTT